MNLKKLLLLILLPGLIVSPTLSQPSKTKEKICENELEIESNRTYTSKEVIEIANIILEESDISIKKSYNEGYKQATIELLPKLEEEQNKNKKNKKHYIVSVVLFSLSSCCAGLIAGVFIGK